MGNSWSLLTQYDIEAVQDHVNGKFSQEEIAALYKRFCALDRNGKGFISADEFMAIPEFALNPLSQRFVRMLEGVNFKDFVQWLSAFSPRAALRDKAQLIFRVYDSDGDGRVSKSNILSVLSDLSGTFLSDSEREVVVVKALTEAGFSESDLLTEDDFCKVLGTHLKMEVEIPVDD